MEIIQIFVETQLKLLQDDEVLLLMHAKHNLNSHSSEASFSYFVIGNFPNFSLFVDISVSGVKLSFKHFVFFHRLKSFASKTNSFGCKPFSHELKLSPELSLNFNLMFFFFSSPKFQYSCLNETTFAEVFLPIVFDAMKKANNKVLISENI